MSRDRRHLDLRLVSLALGCWGTAYVGLRTTAGTGWLVAAIALGVALGAAVASPVLPAPNAAARAAGWICVATLLGVSLGAAATACRVADRADPDLAALVRAGAKARVGLIAEDDPKPVAGQNSRSMILITARTLWIEPDRAPAGPAPGGRIARSARIILIASGDRWRDLLPGQRFQATGRLARARGGDLRAGTLLATGDPPLVEPAPRVQVLAAGLRAGLRSSCHALPPEPGGLLPGLVIGDTGRMDPALADDFRATGMTHLTAVSGANCAIVVGAVLFLVGWCRVGPRLAALLSVVALVGFVILARPSPSVLRAAVMGGIGLLGLAAGRHKAAVPALAVSVIVLVVADPELAADAGFVLSVCATAGILLLAPCWAAALRARRVPVGLAEALAVALSAQVACLPVIAMLSGSVSLVAVPANILAAPAVPPSTILGVVVTVLAPLWPAGGGFLAWLASWPVRWLVLVAHTGAGVPGGSLPWPSGLPGALLLVALGAAGLLLARSALLRKVLLTVMISVPAGVIPVRLAWPGWPPPGWFVVACDVGQGDALVLSSGPGQAVVVDAGPAPGPIDACLRSLGVEVVPLLLISHSHADHIGGIRGVLRGRSIGGIGLAAQGADHVRPDATVGPQRLLRAGERIVVGAVKISVLGPVQPLFGTRSDANNNSLVVRAEVRGHQVLLPGDAGTEQQAALLEQGAVGGLRADVFKVPHHGSADQDQRLVPAIAPSVCLISVGRDNRLGHPAPSVLSSLRGAGVKCGRTDQDGSVAVTAHGGGLALVSRGSRAGPSRRWR